MDNETTTMLDLLKLEYQNQANIKRVAATAGECESLRLRLRTLLVALLGVSLSVCAFASQPEELELDHGKVAQQINDVNIARRITKPTIRVVLGCGKLSACVTAVTSLLLLIAVMSKENWWRRGARWLAAPALLVAAREAVADASDALLGAALRDPTGATRSIVHLGAASVLVTLEILIWYFIAKFFDYDPPEVDTKSSKKTKITKTLLEENNIM